MLTYVCALGTSQAQTGISHPPLNQDRSALHDFVQIAPYWTAKGGWHTDLQLRNNLAGGTLTVRPSLRQPDGTETDLKPVTLLPGEVQSINLMDALMAVNSSLAGQANAYGSVALRYQAKSLKNLYGSVMVHDTGHQIMYHIDANHQAPKYVTGSREGIWWLPNAATRDYLIVTNQGDESIAATLRLYDAAGKGSSQPLELKPRETQRLSVRQLLAEAGIGGPFGGIKIDVPKGTGSIDTAHFVFDEVSGFSATLKMFDYSSTVNLSEHDFAHKGVWTTRAPMLALRSPDPVLALPAKVVLYPMLILRNVTPDPIKASVQFHWRSAAKDGRSALPDVTLSPFETRKVDVSELQLLGAIPMDAHWAQVSVTTDSLPYGLMAVAASYSSSLKYGAQTPFSDQLISHLEGGQWQVDNTHTSLIAAGNGSDKPVKAGLTFMYDQGRKHYSLENTIGPNDQWWVDIGQLIRNQVPDKDGNILPVGVSSGAYQLQEIGAVRQDALYEGKVITDKTYGHATYGCMICCGYNGSSFGVLPYLSPDPLTVNVSDSGFVSAYGTNGCSGVDQNVSSYYTSWDTGDARILTVSSGMVTGIAPGATWIRGYASYLPSGDGAAVERGESCPVAFQDTSGGGNVLPNLSITQLQYTNSVPMWQDSPGNPTPTPMSQTVWTQSSTLPSLFVSGSQMAVTATFSVTPAPTTAIAGASIEGTVAGLGTDCDECQYSRRGVIGDGK
jgi:hypothetical protein